MQFFFLMFSSQNSLLISGIHTTASLSYKFLSKEYLIWYSLERWRNKMPRCFQYHNSESDPHSMRLWTYLQHFLKENQFLCKLGFEEPRFLCQSLGNSPSTPIKICYCRKLSSSTSWQEIFLHTLNFQSFFCIIVDALNIDPGCFEIQHATCLQI